MGSVSGSSLSAFKVFAIEVGGLALSSYHKSVSCCQGKRSFSVSDSFLGFLTGLDDYGTVLIITVASPLSFCFRTLFLSVAGFREFLSSNSSAAASLNSVLFDGSFVVSYGLEFSFSGSVDFL